MENPFKKAVENNEEIENDIKEDIQETQDETATKQTEQVTEEAVIEEKNEWQEKYETLNNQYIRLAADFDNFRKRQEAERESHAPVPEAGLSLHGGLRRCRFHR